MVGELFKGLGIVGIIFALATMIFMIPLSMAIEHSEPSPVGYWAAPAFGGLMAVLWLLGLGIAAICLAIRPRIKRRSGA